MTKASSRVLIDRDKMNLASKRSVAGLCVRIFSAIENFPRELQLMALAAAFVLLSDATSIPAQDAMTATKNLMADPMTSTGLAPQFQAMRFHLNTDVLVKE